MQVEAPQTRLVLGHPDDRTSASIDALAAALRADDFIVEGSANVRRDVWAKLQVNITGGLYACLTDLSLGAAYGEPLCQESVRGLVDEVVALEQVADVSLTATVELTEVAWGTRIDMVCQYPPSRDPYGDDREWPYVLVVTATDGTTSELSSWRAGPGSTARLGAGTALDPEDIASIEVRAAADGRVLLRGEPGGPPAG